MVSHEVLDYLIDLAFHFYNCQDCRWAVFFKKEISMHHNQRYSIICFIPHICLLCQKLAPTLTTDLLLPTTYKQC